MLRKEVVEIVAGSVFLFIGLVACSIAAIRRRSGERIVVWLGIWSAMYGAARLIQSPLVLEVSSRWFQISAPYANTAMTYLFVVVGSLSFLELSLGRLRSLIQIGVFLGLAIAVSGIVFFILTGSSNRLIPYNNLLAACLLLVLMTVIGMPRLSRKYLVQPDRVLAMGTFVSAAEALYNNLSHLVGFETPRILDHFGFGILLFSFGYVALQLVLTNERRLLAVENELAIAREIQMSILPSCVPEINNLSIKARYRPMTAVAGDFYGFIPVDQNRVGILVADVTGHGVPAALIACMIKVALQSVIVCAHNPSAVLSGLNRALFEQLHGQFISVAYLWLDVENREALYSAAGHPPLLRWRQDKLERVESNGLLFGVRQECNDYPVCAMPIAPGDRFLLYTDGVTEAENVHGDSFGDIKLEQVVRAGQRVSPSELADELLSELCQWQPASVSQQDDITLIVIDVV